MSFKDKVLKVVAEIPKGSLLSYSDVAALAGSPGASRAVGTIMKGNKDKDIPCYRVVGKCGKLGGYNGGISKKMMLLDNEGSIDNLNLSETTLSFIIEDEKILLGYKKRGFGVGWWNGFGGKLKKGESIEENVKREVNEECGLRVQNMIKMGELFFKIDTENKILKVHLYRILKYTGEPKETDEMKPKWFGIKEIPYKKMWSDDIYWLPSFLEGKYIKGYFYFKDNETMVEKIVDCSDSHSVLTGISI